MLNDSRNNSIRSNMKRYCSCRERQCTDNKWLWNFAPALTREQYNVRWCNSWREAVIGQENHLSWNYTPGSIYQDHFFSFSVSVPILFAGSLCVCPYPSICFSQRYVCFSPNLHSLQLAYHSEHTAWLLDAECLHYLEHIHNALCLATLHGTDEWTEHSTPAHCITVCSEWKEMEGHFSAHVKPEERPHATSWLTCHGPRWVCSQSSSVLPTPAQWLPWWQRRRCTDPQRSSRTSGTESPCDPHQTVYRRRWKGTMAKLELYTFRADC